MIANIVIFCAQTLILHLLFYQIDRRRPPRRNVDISHLGPEERRRLARFADRLGSGLCLVAWPTLTVGWFLLFRWLSEVNRPRVEGSVFVLRPTWALTLLSAVFAGIVLAGPVGLLMFRACVGRRYRELMACGDAHFRFDARELLYLYFVWIIPICIDWEAGWMGCSMVFTKNAIRVKGFGSSRPAVHRYADIIAIDEVKNYDENPAAMFPARRFRILFKDGKVWTMPHPGYTPRESDRTIIEYVAKQAHKPIRWVAKID